MHCPQGSTEPKSCPSGTYTDQTGADVCTLCPQGYYCDPNLVQAGNIDTIYMPCPAGYYCPNGTYYNWQPCPAGTYSNRELLGKAEDCTACEPGYYCNGVNLTAPTDHCDEGYYCTSGVDTPKPLLLNDTQCLLDRVHQSVGDLCPIGHYCPRGSGYPVPCPAGSYQNTPGRSQCEACPPGYYCLTNTSDYLVNECPGGYYCPAGTTDPHQHACPPGTFNNLTRQKGFEACQACPPGKYCHGYGNNLWTDDCDPGYYCLNGSDVAQPIAPSMGGRCEAGYYCPQGSGLPVPCTEGYYCNISGLNASQDLCEPGWYCPVGSSSAQQLMCPVGYYCPVGTSHPLPCTNGTYGDRERLVAQSECRVCDPGFYCNQTASTSPTGPCQAGYYCPEGQTTPNPTEYICWTGHYCAGNNDLPVRCSDGFYQNEEGSTSCKQCPPGYYCDNSPAPVSNLTGYECPIGFYCPLQTKQANQYPCASGTYNNRTRITSQTECYQCPPRYYCRNSGLSQPEGLCFAGYYCNGSTIDPITADNLCPIGNYCPEGSYQPMPCPSGSIATTSGNTDISDCQPCPRGQYCTEQSSQNSITLPCAAGYICTGGSDTPTPTNGSMGYICPLGHYCLEGDIVERPCAPGTYSPETGSSSCYSCPQGTTCPFSGMNQTLDCPMGYYCNNGTVSDGIPCPIGTFNDRVHQDNISDCVPCSAGSYCDRTGLSEPTGNCTAGYLCLSGATQPQPNDGTNGPCPVGHYCITGATSATMCPPGTIRDVPGAASEDDCYPCPAGFYCDKSGLTAPTGVCDERYYCPDFAKISSPQPTNYQCPKGFYCGNATATPEACPPGTYQPSLAKTNCETCPAGYYCLTNSSVPENCPAYHYCPQGSIQPTPCPSGTFTEDTTTNLSTSSQCKVCINGSYCIDGRITGPCAAGFWCKSGSDTPTPLANETLPHIGEPCPFGYYCPEGTVTPQECPVGKVITWTGAASEGECSVCPAGYICPPNSIPEFCWPGYYCPYDDTEHPCPKATYLDTEGGKNLTDCKPCPAGYYCHQEGMADYRINPCPPGYYCYQATWSPIPCPAGTFRAEEAAGNWSDCHLCPAGYYCSDINSTTNGTQCDTGYVCPLGSQNQRLCQAGYYCNMSKTEEYCPPGYYCPAGSEMPTPCPDGHYCPVVNDTGVPRGAIEPVKCPPGYRMYDGSLQSTFEDTCQPCPPGYYGNHPERLECLPCRAGIVCHMRATTDKPLANGTDPYSYQDTNSYICPPGYYCPQNSSMPTPCNPGTYNAKSGMGHIEDCIPCAVDHFNHLYGQSACFSCGGEATQPHRGQPSCTCTGAGREFQPSDRTCPCSQHYSIIVGREQDCVKTVYERCPETYVRTQAGQCWLSTEWDTYCQERVCGGADQYLGYQKLISFCLCKVQDLEQVCDEPCRIQSKHMITFHCPEEPMTPFIQVKKELTDGTLTTVSEIPVKNLGRIINSRNSIGADQCEQLGAPPQTIHFVQMTADGFLGVYKPDGEQVNNLLVANSKGNYQPNVTLGTLYNYPYTRRRLLATTTTTNFTGVNNPIVCLENGELMMFFVTNEFYPVYDRDNLLNTNEKFDYGGFRELVELMAQMDSTTTLFSYRFRDPGLYVFYLSTNINLKMYVRVMAQDATCTDEGPFFPLTARYAVQNGMVLDDEILKAPDWVVICILLAAVFLVIILLIIALVLFRKYGWRKTLFLIPRYRFITGRYNFDDYSSKGSSLRHLKKVHRLQTAESASHNEVALVQPTGFTVRARDEFWDYERQIDLEAFDSQQVYDIMAAQSKQATLTLAKQKDEVKSFYQKMSCEAESLKCLWATKFHVGGKMGWTTADDVVRYEAKLTALNTELERRKELGRSYLAVMQQLKDLTTKDEQSREDHQVTFDAAYLEAESLLQAAANDMKYDTKIYRLVNGRVRLLLQKMSGELNKECTRLGSWGVLSQGTGAQLLYPGRREPVKKQHLLGSDPSQLKDLIKIDKTTLLMTPKQGCQLLLDNGEVINAPEHCFVHPQTGRVLPIMGNVSYDPKADKLIFTVDSATGEACSSDEPVIPFIIYPTNPTTGKPTTTKLKSLDAHTKLIYNGPMEDPETGLHVPILAVTIHPETGAILPVGGSHIDPVTGLPVAIELGSLMVDPTTGRVVPILSVTIDNQTGAIIPVGGCHVVHGRQVPILPSDTFTEPLSGKPVRVGGAYINSDVVLPSSGGNQALLDSCVLACEARLLDVLHAYAEAVTGDEALFKKQDVNVHHEITALNVSVKELAESREYMKTSLLRWQHDISRMEENARRLATTGGSPGMYKEHKTGLLLPILIGSYMDDPAGSELEVPILGSDNDKSGVIRPLGGTMEDPQGSGLVPIMIGVKAVDPVSGQLSPVVGVRMAADTNTVVPVTQSSSMHRKQKPAFGAVTLLEEEIIAHQSYWRRHDQQIRELIDEEFKLVKLILYDIDHVDFGKIKDLLDGMGEKAYVLNEASKQETKRRAKAKDELGLQLAPDVVTILTEGDESAHKADVELFKAHTKFVQLVEKFIQKFSDEEQRLKERLATLDGAMDPEREEIIHQQYRQTKSRLEAELKEHLVNRVELLDEEFSSVQYAKQKCEILAKEAKDVLLGVVYTAGNFTYILFGAESDANSANNANMELVSLLKQLIVLLESGAPFVLSSDIVNMLEGGSINIKGGDINIPGASFTDTNNSGAPIKHVTVTDTQLLTRAYPQEKSVIDSSFLVNADKLVPSNSKSSDEKKLLRNLYTRQTYEAVRLEGSLMNNEMEVLAAVVKDFEDRKQGVTDDISKDLKKQLMKVKDDSERDKIVLDYATNLQRLTDALEKQRQNKLEAARKQLIADRRKEKKNLHQRHISEAKTFGLPPDAVPSIIIPSYEEMDKGLIKLSREQEDMLAQLRKLKAEFDNEDFPNYVDDLETRIKAMDLTDAAASSIIKKMKVLASKKLKHEKDLKIKLKSRTDRGKKGESGNSDITEADRLTEENALLSTVKNLDEEEAMSLQREAIQEALKGHPEEEISKLIAQYNSDMFQVKSNLAALQHKHRDKLLAKLAAQKRMKQELDKERAISAELNRITEEQADKGESDVAELVSRINTYAARADSSPEGQQLLEGQLQKQIELELMQKEKEHTLYRELTEDANNKLQLVDVENKQQKQLSLEEFKAKFDQEMLLKGKDLTDEEFQKLLKQHKDEVEAVCLNYDREKDRQKKALLDKLEARHKALMASLAENNSVEMAKELSRQQQQRDEFNEKKAKEIENKTLAAGVEGKSAEEKENFVYFVLRQRHMKEAIHLTNKLERDRNVRMAALRAEINSKRTAEREKLLDCFDQEMAELIANSGHLSPEELSQKKDSLRKKHQAEIDKFDDLTTELMKDGEQQLLLQLDIEHTHENLELKSRQLAELAEAMKSYSPKDELIKQYEEEAVHAKEAAAHYRDEIMKKMQDELEQHKILRKREEEERKKKLQQQLRELDTQLQSQWEQEREYEMQKQRERECALQQQLAEKKQQDKKELFAKAKTDEEREKLLKDHEENIAKFEESLSNEQQRQAKALNAKLSARHQRREAAEKAKLEKDHLLQQEAEREKQLLLRKQTTPQTVARSDQSSVLTPGGKMDDMWLNMLMSSPLFQQINDLEDLLEKDTPASVHMDRVVGADYSRLYIDVKDAQWLCRGDLVPADINSLSPSQFVIYHFGVFVIQMLKQTVGTPDVTLLLASNLPPNSYNNNCFRHSFFYQHTKKILFVRLERTESVGDFILVLVHCLAHIQVDHLADDTNPLFLHFFYKALKVVCRDMFFSRTRISPTSHNMTGRGTLESILKPKQTQDQKASITKELIDTCINPPDSDHFGAKLHDYQKASENIYYNQMLAAQVDFGMQGNYVEKCMWQLKGLSITPSESLTSKHPTNCPSTKTHKDVMSQQLQQLQSKCDELNEELIEVMKMETSIIEEIEQSESGHKTKPLKEELKRLLNKKHLLIKHITQIENEIKVKEKLLAKA